MRWEPLWNWRQLPPNVGSYECTCDSGYTGGGTNTGCTDINECAGNPCGTGGNCTTPNVGSYECTCDSGYTGGGTNSDCVEIDECSPNPCQNGGTCTDGVDDYACACPNGYSGVSCEIEPTCSEELPVFNPLSGTCTGCRDPLLGFDDCGPNPTKKVCKPTYLIVHDPDEPHEIDDIRDDDIEDPIGPGLNYPGVCVICTISADCDALYGAPPTGTRYSCQALTNTCVSVVPSCPTNASGAPNCTCNSGYTGTLTWNGYSWSGTCTSSGGGPGGPGGPHEEIHK